jgi:hypothetical protein
MPNVLTTGSTVTCPHQGTVATSGDARLRVAGAPVLLLDGVQGASVSACPVADSSTPTTKCRIVVSASGVASKLTVGGRGVVLETLVGATDGVSPAGNALAAAAQQTKLQAT